MAPGGGRMAELSTFSIMNNIGVCGVALPALPPTPPAVLAEECPPAKGQTGVPATACPLWWGTDRAQDAGRGARGAGRGRRPGPQPGASSVCRTRSDAEAPLSLSHFLTRGHGISLVPPRTRRSVPPTCQPLCTESSAAV